MRLARLAQSLLVLALLGGSALADGTGQAQPAVGNGRLLWIDLETSGFNGEIIQIAGITTDRDGSNPIKVMNLKVKPVGPVGAQAASVNHYTPQGWRRAVPVARALDLLDQELQAGAQLAGHNIRGFDVPFMKKVYAREGRTFPVAATQAMVDTQDHAKALAKQGVIPNAQLGTVASHYGISNAKAHDAMGDIVTTVKVHQRASGVPARGPARAPRR